MQNFDLGLNIQFYKLVLKILYYNYIHKLFQISIPLEPYRLTMGFSKYQCIFE